MANRVVVRLITSSALNAETLKSELAARATISGVSGSKTEIGITQPDAAATKWHVYGHLIFPDFFKAHSFYDSVQNMWATIPFVSMVESLSSVTLDDEPGSFEPSNQAVR